jgi:hypothetical protein
VKKPKKSYENRLNDNHSPIGVLDNSKNDLVFSQSNGQGLLQGWNSLLVRPEPLLIKDIKVQVNKQKPSNVGPAQMKHNNDKMTIAPMSASLAYPCWLKWLLY